MRVIRFDFQSIFWKVLSRKRELTEFWAKLAEFCEKLKWVRFGAQTIERSSLSSLPGTRWGPRFTEFGVWNRAIWNHFRSVSDEGDWLSGTPLLWPLSRYTVSRTQCRSKFLQFSRYRSRFWRSFLLSAGLQVFGPLKWRSMRQPRAPPPLGAIQGIGYGDRIADTLSHILCGVFRVSLQKPATPPLRGVAFPLPPPLSHLSLDSLELVPRGQVDMLLVSFPTLAMSGHGSCLATPLSQSLCREEACLQKRLALHGGVAATLTPIAPHCATKTRGQPDKMALATCPPNWNMRGTALSLLRTEKWNQSRNFGFQKPQTPFVLGNSS